MTVAPPDRVAFSGVQRPILQPVLGRHAAHGVLEFPTAQAGMLFLRLLLDRGGLAFGPRAERGSETPGEVEASLGLTAEGLRRLAVPRAYLSVLGRVAPAFMQGAPARAAAHTGDTGPSSPARWDEAFGQRRCHAVLSLHATEDAALRGAIEAVGRLLSQAGLHWHGGEPFTGAWLGRPEGFAGPVVRAGVPAAPDPRADRERWVHFGYRDGLSQVAVRGFPPPRRASDPAASSAVPQEPPHEPGEFLLGYENDVGSNPGLLPTAPRRIRGWLRDGSFGVLRVIDQRVDAFESYVTRTARAFAPELGRAPPAEGSVDEQMLAYVKAKLCGRWPDGRHFDPIAGDRPLDADAPPSEAAITAPFDHRADPDGVGCPYAAHIRRMHPRPGPEAAAAGLAHARPRALLRRGTPFGPWGGSSRRGLLGWFFCARLEDQFEHLLGEWADRMPLGQPGGHASKDPLIGQQESWKSVLGQRPPADLPPGTPPLSAPFVVPVRTREETREETRKETREQTEEARKRRVVERHFDPPPVFSITRGMAYAFYPSREALRRIASFDFDLQDDPEIDAP